MYQPRPKTKKMILTFKDSSSDSKLLMRSTTKVIFCKNFEMQILANFLHANNIIIIGMLCVYG